MSRVRFDVSSANGDGWFSVVAPYTEKRTISAIPGRQWEPKTKTWDAPIESIEHAKRLFPEAVLSDDLVSVLDEAAARVHERIEAKNAEVTVEVPGLKRGPLYPYQMQGLAFLDTLRVGEGAILAFDMGLGKSLVSIAFALLKIFAQGAVKYCMIVCPAPLKYATWASEIFGWAGVDFVVIDGDVREEVQGNKALRTTDLIQQEDGTHVKLSGRALRKAQYAQHKSGIRFFVMNYELFQDDYKSIKWVKERNLTEEEIALLGEVELEVDDEVGNYLVLFDEDQPATAEQKFLQRIGYDPDMFRVHGRKRIQRKVPQEDIMPHFDEDWMVVLDEAHRIKTAGASTTKTIVKKIRGAGLKVLSTGTPLENNIGELWSLVNLCRPGLLGKENQFSDRYIEQDDNGSYTGVPIRERLSELTNRIAPLMIRKTKAEALPDLPEMTVIDHWVTMTEKQAEIYEQVKEGILEEGGETKYLDALAQLTRFQQILDSPALLSEYLGVELPEESGKLLELPLILSEINPGENKVIIFSQYKSMTEIIVRKLREWYPQYHTAYVRGGMTGKARTQRDEDIKRFQNDETCRFIVITTAGNYGLNLQSANYVIAYDETFNPQKMEQIYSRAHRNGQKRKVIAINLKTRDSYEENKSKMLTSKRELFSGVIDGDDAAFSRLMGGAEDLLKLI